MAGTKDGAPGKGALEPKVVAAITAALGMHLQNEKIRFRILSATIDPPGSGTRTARSPENPRAR